MALEKDKTTSLTVEIDNMKKKNDKNKENSFNETSVDKIHIGFLETKKKSTTGIMAETSKHMKNSSISSFTKTAIRVPSVPNLHKAKGSNNSNKKKHKHSKKKDEDEPHNFDESSRIINAPKGIGINEQNIYQIICKTSDHQSKDTGQYLAEFYKGKLDEKAKEVSKLRNTLRNLKEQLKGKCGKSQCRKARSASFGISLNSSNVRSKSQSWSLSCSDK